MKRKVLVYLFVLTIGVWFTQAVSESLIIRFVEAANALLDGVIHSDTTDSAVTRGDLLYGNATPAWDDLAIGAANTVLTTNGTDPAWSTVTGVMITDDTIDSADYAAGSIDAEHLAADIIDETKIADNGIDSEHYNDGSIDAIHLAADIIDETKIADNGIDSEHYNDDSIDAEHINTITCGTNCTWDATNDEIDVDDAFLLLAGDSSSGDYILTGTLNITGGTLKGDLTGNADTVTNATFTTALTVNTGTLTLTADAGNDSVLTIGGGAVSVSGSNTGDDSGTDDQTIDAFAIDGNNITCSLESDGEATKTADISSTTAVTANTNKTTESTTAGRSLTLSTYSVEADAELYTDTKGIYFEDPTAADDFKSIWFAKQACVITSIWAESDQTVTFMLQKDDGSPADLDTVDLAPAAGVAEDTSLDGDATFAAGDRLDLAVTSVANTPTWVSIFWTFEYSD